jgi:hypothetical protein
VAAEVRRDERADHAVLDSPLAQIVERALDEDVAEALPLEAWLDLRVDEDDLPSSRVE